MIDCLVLQNVAAPARLPRDGDDLSPFERLLNATGTGRKSLAWPSRRLKKEQTIT